MKQDIELGIGCTLSQAAEAYKAIFRGFVNRLSGEEIIRVGETYYTGHWVYWNEYGTLLTSESDNYLVSELGPALVIETVTRFVRLDTEGTPIFEHDIVDISYTQRGYDMQEETREVKWDRDKSCYTPFDWEHYCENCDDEIEFVKVIKHSTAFDISEEDPMNAFAHKTLGRLLSIKEVHDLKVVRDGADKVKVVEEGSGISVDGYVLKTEKHRFCVLIDNFQDCCESWGYFSTNDFVQDFLGKQLVEVNLTDTALNKKKVEENGADYLDAGGIQFVDFKFKDGSVLQLAVYNGHNGYYGHAIYVIKDNSVILNETI